MRKSAFILLLASVLSLASCNGKNKNQTHDTGTVSSVSLSESEKEVYLGKRSSDVTVTIAGEGEFNKTVKLSSDNPAIAEGSFTEVDSTETFKVYGKSLGETVIHVTSVQDETKAASLSVKVVSKEVVVVSEILSVSLSRETKLFKLNENDPQPSEEISMTLNGRGSYDDSATIALSANPTVSVDKTELRNGQTFRVTAVSVGETTITVTSKQDTNKSATLVVRVDPYTPAVQPQTEVVQLDCVKHTLQEGGSDFRVSAYAQGGDIVWSWKENDAETYVHLGDHDNTGATVTPVAATPDGKKATLVATLGSQVAECEFTVAERPTDVRTFYVSNNGFLGYTEVYFHAWNEYESIAPWPGTKLENPVQNTNGEDCYPFTVDILRYTEFKFNNGKEGTDPEFKETEEVSFAQFGSHNNVWFDAEGHANFATLQKDEPTIRFDKNTVDIYKDSTEVVEFTVRKGNASFEVVSGADNVGNINITNGTISIKGVAVGDATIRVYIDGTEAEDFLHVHVLDNTGVKQLFFSNNKGWENVYLYAWNDNSNKHEWPGEKLENVLKNSLGEDVYSFYISFSQWKNIILNNGEGQQTVDISLAWEGFNTYNNIYPDSDSSPYEIGAANFEGFTYSVAFEAPSVEVHNGKDVNVRVNANASGVTYNVTSGSDKVEIIAFGDDFVKLRYIASGSATVVASVGGVTATLSVTTLDTPAPDSTQTYYFTNNKGWEHVYLYYWNESGNNHDWPGEELTHSQLNAYNEPVFDFELDPTEWMYFIVNNGNDQKTVDISLDNVAFATNDNVYPDGDSSPYAVGFATFTPAAPVVSVAFAVDEVTVHDNANETVAVTAENDTGVTYEVTSGATYVSIVNQSDSSIELHFLAEGDAVITATLGTATDTLTVHCLSSAHVHSYDPSTHECACGALDPDYVKVTFSVNYGTVSGQDIYICGLKNVWDATDRVAMSWTEGNNWVATLTLQKDVEITFKFIMVQGSNVTWEKDGEGNERHYTPTTTTTEVMTWGVY